MVRILVCRDDMERVMQTKYYSEEIYPSLTQAGHEVQLTVCTQAIDFLDNYPADVLLMFVPRKQSSCWETARRLREVQGGDPSPLILAIIEWGPDDSPDDPAYYARPEYAKLFDSYHRGFWGGSKIARWVDDFLTRSTR